MNQPIEMTCDDGCKKTFTITKVRKIKVKDGIEKTYFRCTHCKHEYAVSYASEATAKLQRQMRKLNKSIQTLADKSEEGLTAYWKEVDELKDRVKQSMDDDRRIAEG